MRVVFCFDNLCSYGGYQCFRRAYCHSDSKVELFLRDAGNHLRDCTSSQPRETQILRIGPCTKRIFTYVLINNAAKYVITQCDNTGLQNKNY
jgi:hypothetical protein